MNAFRNKPGRYILAIVLFVVGLIVVVVYAPLIPIGWVVGPVLCIFAILLALRNDKVWRCTKCQAIVARG